jgi:hypothetical protein
MTRNTLMALTLIKSANDIQGYHATESYNLELDFINREIQDEDDIILAGKYCTIFIDDLEDCNIVKNTIYIRGHYILHIK